MLPCNKTLLLQQGWFLWLQLLLLIPWTVTIFLVVVSRKAMVVSTYFQEGKNCVAALVRIIFSHLMIVSNAFVASSGQIFLIIYGTTVANKAILVLPLQALLPVMYESWSGLQVIRFELFLSGFWGPNLLLDGSLLKRNVQQLLCYWCEWL